MRYGARLTLTSSKLTVCAAQLPPQFQPTEILAECVLGPVVVWAWKKVQVPVAMGAGVATELAPAEEPQTPSEYSALSTCMNAIPPDVVRYQPFTT